MAKMVGMKLWSLSKQCASMAAMNTNTAVLREERTYCYRDVCSAVSSKQLVYSVLMVTCDKAMFVVMQSIIPGKALLRCMRYCFTEIQRMLNYDQMELVCNRWSVIPLIHL